MALAGITLLVALLKWVSRQRIKYLERIQAQWRNDGYGYHQKQLKALVLARSRHFNLWAESLWEFVFINMASVASEQPIRVGCAPTYRMSTPPMSIQPTGWGGVQEPLGTHWMDLICLTPTYYPLLSS